MASSDTASNTGKEPDVYVLLDTNALWNAFNSEGSLAFRTLTALGAKGVIRICVAEVVLRESTSQLMTRVAEHQQATAKALDGLRQFSPAKLHTKLDEATGLIAAQIEELSLALQARVQTWTREARVMILPVQEDHGRRVIEAYFSGGAPFKQAKSREDFPDGFIWQALVDLAADKRRDIQFVCNDAAFEKHLAGTELPVTLHKDIPSLLKSGFLPVTAEEADYKLVRMLRAAVADVEGSVRNVLHHALTAFNLPMPSGVTTDANAGPFRIERVLALKGVVADGDAITAVGNKTFAIPFTTAATVRAAYESKEDAQEGTFAVLKTERIRGDYEMEFAGSCLLQIPSGDRVSDALRVEIDEVRVLTCASVPFAPDATFTGEVAIRWNREALAEAIRSCRGLVLIIGRSRTRRNRAASVLLNDAALAHPDGFFLATHGYLAATSTGSVRALERSSFKDDETFNDKLFALQPNGFSMHIRDIRDLETAQAFAVGTEMLVIGVTDATTPEELKDLTERIWSETITVVAK